MDLVVSVREPEILDLQKPIRPQGEDQRWTAWSRSDDIHTFKIDSPKLSIAVFPARQNEASAGRPRTIQLHPQADLERL
jgi:hypothetical protein